VADTSSELAAFPIRLRHVFQIQKNQPRGECEQSALNTKHFVMNSDIVQVYDYCIQNKLVDAALIAKWKKPGYERLCSTYVINTKNYKFGTVSICRVPKHSLGADTVVEDPFTGCLGCASGPGGQRNIFGNKYGQYLAAIQVAREDEKARRQAAKAAASEERGEEAPQKSASSGGGGGNGDAETDEEGGDDDGAEPDSIWAVNEKERMMETADDADEGAGCSAESSNSASYGGDGGGKRPKY
jgi:hypothetical protein